MTFRQIALKNLRFHSRHYVAFFLSCTFTVWLFYQYMLLLTHPILYQEVIPQQFVFFLYVVQVLILLFSLLFIGYSQSAFLRNRKQDLGLWQILGMDVQQVTRILFWEYIFIGCLAILLALIIGTITSKLFFLAVSVVLRLERPIPFHFSWTAGLVSLTFYFCLFAFLAWWSRFTIKKKTIADLFRQAIQSKKPPSFSPKLVLLAVVAWGSSYGLAFKANLFSLPNSILPILLLLFVGSYLSFSQGSLYLVERLRRSPLLAYRSQSLLMLAQLRFRIRNQARILFMISMMCTLVLTSVGISLTYYLKADQLAVEQMPDSLSVIGQPGGVTPQAIRNKMRQLGLQLREAYHFPIITHTKHGVWIAEKDFAYLWKRTKQKPPLSLAKGEALWVRNHPLSPSQKVGNPPHRLSMAGMAWTIKGEMNGLFFNENETMRTLIVIANDDFQKLDKRVASKQKITVSTYQFSPWQKSRPLFDFISRAMEREEGKKVNPVLRINGVWMVYQVFQQIFAPLVFVSLFMGFLFFLAVGSLLYFRLFTELPYDRQQMGILQKIGIDEQEILSIQVWQIRLLFLIPFVVGFLHALVAMNLFGSLFQQPVWSPFFLVVGVYLLVYGGYYLWVKRLYSRALFALE